MAGECTELRSALGLPEAEPEWEHILDDDEKKKIEQDFDETVNMTPKALKRWLDSDESKSVGQSDGGSESVGHHSGRRIIEIRGKAKGDLTDGDYAHMKKVVGYVARHLAQRPKGDTTDTRWAYSLKNWGHDPSKG